MFARISTAQVQSGQIDEYLEIVEQLKPAMSKLPGLVKFYQLMNRETQKGMMIALYETEAAAIAAREEAQATVAKVAPLLVVETISVEGYEVEVSSDPDAVA
jgi:heme-degrading monooxygenase HmoA